MKKRLLFVIDNLGLGGAEKSLVSLLQSIDYNRYEVDLFLFDKTGMFMELLPVQVNVLEPPQTWIYFTLPIMKSLTNLLKLRRLDLLGHRAMLFLKSNFLKLTQVRQQNLWNHFSAALPEMKDEYDVAIGYMEKYPNYFVVDKVIAKRKIGWIHIDYKTYKLDKVFDEPYFKQLDYIIGVSQSCVNTLRECFSSISNKFILLENISSLKLIKEMAKQDIIIERERCIIVTAARLVEQKGIDLSIQAASLLGNSGYKFKWIILGDGPLRNYFIQVIKSKGLENNVLLKGAVANPYPYIKAADIYVQTSRFEGKSISIDEAKILCKPIVATKFPTVYDQIRDGETGILADMNAVDIFDKIKFLIDNPHIRNQFEVNLSEEVTYNENILEGFYNLIA